MFIFDKITYLGFFLDPWLSIDARFLDLFRKFLQLLFHLFLNLPKITK